MPRKFRDFPKIFCWNSQGTGLGPQRVPKGAPRSRLCRDRSRYGSEFVSPARRRAHPRKKYRFPAKTSIIRKKFLRAKIFLMTTLSKGKNFRTFFQKKVSRAFSPDSGQNAASPTCIFKKILAEKRKNQLLFLRFFFLSIFSWIFRKILGFFS